MYKGNVQLLPVVDEKASSRECQCDCEDVSSLLSRLLLSLPLSLSPSSSLPAPSLLCRRHGLLSARCTAAAHRCMDREQSAQNAAHRACACGSEVVRAQRSNWRSVKSAVGV